MVAALTKMLYVDKLNGRNIHSDLIVVSNTIGWDLIVASNTIGWDVHLQTKS